MKRYPMLKKIKSLWWFYTNSKVELVAKRFYFFYRISGLNGIFSFDGFQSSNPRSADSMIETLLDDYEYNHPEAVLAIKT